MVLDFQWISLIIFVVLFGIFIYRKKKQLDIQKIAFPVLYAGLLRTNFGIRFMQWCGTHLRKPIIIFGYFGVVLGFLGMIIMVLLLLHSVFITLTQPIDPVIPLVLPQVSYPGLGFLPFWYWILALFAIVLLHEFAHGIVAKAHKIKIKSSGLGFFAILIPIVPIAFVEPDEKKVEKAKPSVQYSIFAAGPAANLITTALVVCLFLCVFAPIQQDLITPTGFTFDKMNESYPTTALPDGFVVRTVNGNDVLTSQALIVHLQDLQPGDAIDIGNGSETFSLIAATSPYNEERGFLGMTNFRNHYDLQEGVSEKTWNIFSWIKGLFRWIGILSFLVGLVNLLPLGPVDGGRMMKTLLERIFPGKQAMRLWVNISVFILILLLISMFWPWLMALF